MKIIRSALRGPLDVPKDISRGHPGRDAWWSFWLGHAYLYGLYSVYQFFIPILFRGLAAPLRIDDAANGALTGTLATCFCIGIPIFVWLGWIAPIRTVIGASFLLGVSGLVALVVAQSLGGLHVGAALIGASSSAQYAQLAYFTSRLPSEVGADGLPTVGKAHGRVFAWALVVVALTIPAVSETGRHLGASVAVAGLIGLSCVAIVIALMVCPRRSAVSERRPTRLSLSAVAAARPLFVVKAMLIMWAVGGVVASFTTYAPVVLQERGYPLLVSLGASRLRLGCSRKDGVREPRHVPGELWR